MCVSDKNETTKSCSFYCICSPDDVLSKIIAHFPTDGLLEEVKKTLPDIEKLKSRLSSELFNELERLLKEFEPIFQQSKANCGRYNM